MAAIDDLLFESPIKPFCDPVGLGFGDIREAGGDHPELDLVLECPERYWVACSIRSNSPLAAAAPTEPKRALISMETGCSAANRSPFLVTCQPTHSAFQCSTAVNSQHQPSSEVKTLVPSVPHMTLGAAVMILPSCFLGCPWTTRCGDSKLFSRMRHNTRLRPTLIPFDETQAAPDLAVPLANEGGCLQIGLDEGQYLIVSERCFRTTLQKCRRYCFLGDATIERGAGHFPGETDALHAVGFTSGRGYRGAHFFDLLGAKG